MTTARHAIASKTQARSAAADLRTEGNQATVINTQRERVGSEASIAVRNHIRGSGLLMTGRIISASLQTLCQVLIVRHLSTNDYGSWAYALSVVLFFQWLSSIGFHEAITRFVSFYHERGDYRKLSGTILLCLGSLLFTSTLIITAFYAWPDKLLTLLHQQGPSLKVLFVLIFMVPLEGLDAVLMGLFASLVGARSIFQRQYVVGPALKLGAVLLLIGLHADVLLLAYGYVAASLIGISIYTIILVRRLHAQGFFARTRLRDIRLPLREVFSFTLPMMTTDLLVMLNQSVVVLLLGSYHGMRGVAFYRAVLPAAAMNQAVAITSALLYLPAAARLFAIGDYEGLRNLYWRNATWVAVLTFPILAITLGFARPFTVLLYGQRYADAGPVMAILAAGFYYDVVFGFNGLTLKAMNKVGYLVGCNVTAAVTNVAVNLLLIPRYGAVGAAIGTAATLIVSTTLRQVALGFAIGVSIREKKFFSFYAPVALAATLLVAAYAVVRSNLLLAAMLGFSSLAVVLVSGRRELNIAEIFPESTRVPFMKRFFAKSAV